MQYKKLVKSKIKDAKGRPIEIGSYVLILQEPGYNGVLQGDIGRIVGNESYPRDGTINVDVFAIPRNHWLVSDDITEPDLISKSDMYDDSVHCVNLNFEPSGLRVVEEQTITSRTLPKLGLNDKRISLQYDNIKDYRKL